MEALISKILDGDTNVFAVLVDRYKDLVFTLALRMLKNREEAEEVSQDAFLKVYKSIQRFKGDAKLSTWIYKINIPEICVIGVVVPTDNIFHIHLAE